MARRKKVEEREVSRSSYNPFQEFLKSKGGEAISSGVKSGRIRIPEAAPDPAQAIRSKGMPQSAAEMYRDYKTLKGIPDWQSDPAGSEQSEAVSSKRRGIGDLRSVLNSKKPIMPNSKMNDQIRDYMQGHKSWAPSYQTMAEKTADPTTAHALRERREGQERSLSTRLEAEKVSSYHPEYYVKPSEQPEETEAQRKEFEEYVRKHPEGDGTKIRGTTQEDRENSVPLVSDTAEGYREYQYLKRLSEKPRIGAIAPVLGAALYTGENAVSGVEGLINTAAQMARGDKMEPENMKSAPVVDAIRQGTQRAVRERLGLKNDGIRRTQEKVSDFLTGTVLDAASSTANALLFGGGSLALAGGNAANQELYEDSMNENLSKNQMLGSAITHGIAEAFWERFSLGNFESMKEVPVTGIKQLAKNYAKSFLTEGSEEFATDISNDITDILIKNTASEPYQEYSARIANGENEKSAFMNTVASRLQSAGLSFLGGGLSGGFSSGVASAIGTYGKGAEYRDVFRGNGYQEIANSVDDSTVGGQKAKSIAQQYADRVKRGENISQMERGYLANAIEANMEDAQRLQEANEPAVNQGNTQEEAREEEAAKGENIGKAEEKEEDREELENRKRKWEREALKDWAGNYGAAGKKAFIENFDGTMTVPDYIKTYSDIYNMARYGSLQDDMKTAEAAILGKDKFESIYKAGHADYMKNLKRLANVNYRERQEKRSGGLLESVPETPEALKRTLESLGEKTGILFRVTDSTRYGENGLGRSDAMGGYQSGKGIVTVDLSSENPMATVSHEMTHWIKEYAPIEYADFREAAVRAIVRSKGTDFDSLIETYRKAYGEELSHEELTDEIVADSTGEFLNDRQFIKEVTETQKGIGKRILEWLNSVVDAIREIISKQGLRRASTALAEDLRQYEDARALWMEAVEKSAETMETKEYAGEEREGEKKEGGIKYQLVGHEGNIDVYETSDATKKLTIRERMHHALEIMKGKYRDQKVVFQKDGVTYEAKYDPYGIRKGIFGGKQSDRKGFKTKINIAADGDYVTLAENSNYDKSKAEKGGKKNEFHRDAKNWDYFVKTIKSDGNYFDVLINVKDTGDEHYVYDISLRENKKKRNNSADAMKRFRVQSDPHEETITKHSSDVNEKQNQTLKDHLEGKEEVEESKSLIAVHNLKADKLLKVLSYDGIPMPSIAVTKADYGWEKFGDISLVFRKNTVDPERKGNKVYGADAWTPMFPKLEYEGEQKKIKEIQDRTKRNIEERDIPREMQENAERFLNEMQYAITQGGEAELVKRAEENRGMQALYLSEKGISVPEFKGDDTSIETAEDVLMRTVKKEFGKELPHIYEMGTQEITEKYGERLLELKRESMQKAGKPEKLIQTVLSSMREKGDAYKIMEKASRWQDPHEYARYDEEAAEKFLDRHVDKEGYRKWLSNLFRGSEGKKGVWNGKEPFTKKGKRRNFSELHYDVTPENIVRSMLSQSDNVKNVEGFEGVKTLRAVVKRDIKSIQEMHQREGGLKNLTEEEFKKQQDELNEELLEVISGIRERSGRGDRLEAINQIGNIIQDAAGEKNFSKETLRDTFRKYDIWKVREEDIRKITEIIHAIKEMPVEMFEAKPQRVVNYDEIAAALVPQDTSEEVLDALEKRGIPIQFYDAEIEGDRKQKLQSLDGIRFQLDLEDEMLPGRYEEQTEALRRENAYLTNLLFATRGKQTDETGIRNVAKKLVDDTGSKMSKTVLKEQLAKFYSYIKTAEHLDYQDIMNGARAIANQLIEEAVQPDPEEEEAWRPFRKALHNTIIYISPQNVRDVAPDGIGMLQRKWFGKIRFTTKEEHREKEASAVYRELKGVFPDAFTKNPDDFRNEADAVQEIMDVYEYMRPRMVNIYGDMATQREAAEDIAKEVFDLYYEVGMEKGGKAKSYAKSWKMAKEEARNELLRESNERLGIIQREDAVRLRELRKEFSDGNLSHEEFNLRKKVLTDQKRQQREAMLQKIREQRERYEEGRDRARYKSEVQKDARKLLQMAASPTDQEHIPEPMVKPILDVLSYIDYASRQITEEGEIEERKNGKGEKTKRTLSAEEFKAAVLTLSQKIQEIEKQDNILESENGNASYLTIDPDIVKNLQATVSAFEKNEEAHGNIDILPLKNLREVRDTLRALRRMVETANQFIAEKNMESIAEASEKTVDSLRQRETEKDYAGFIGSLKKLASTGMMDSYTFFHEMGKGGGDRYQALRDALDNKTRKMVQAQEYFEKIKEENRLEDKEMREWSQKEIEITLPAVQRGTLSGTRNKTVKVTKAQLMSLYLLNQREQARMHLYGTTKQERALGIHPKNLSYGGIKWEPRRGRLGVMQDNNTVYKLSEGLLSRLLNEHLSEKEKRVAAAIGRFLTGETSAWGNEATLNLYGYRKFMAKDYFPIRVDDTSIGINSEALERGMTMLKNMGMTKATQQRTFNPLIVQDIFDVFVDQVDKMSSYSAYMPAVSDLEKWYNYKGVKGNVHAELQRVMGKNGIDYFTNLLRDLNGSRGRNEWGGLYGIAGKYKGALIGANLRSAIQQPTAYVRAMAVMNPKYLLEGLTLKPGKMARQEFELCKKYAPIAAWKELGSYDINVGRSMKGMLIGGESALEKLQDSSMYLLEKGDEVAWVRLWWAAQAQVKDTTKLSPGTEEFYQEAARIFNHVIDTTQVVDSVLHRSDLMKSKGTWEKIITSFMSEPTKTYNVLYRMASDIKHEEKGAKKRAARVVVAVLLSQALTSAAASIVSAMRDPDKDKKYGKKWREKFLQDFLSSIQPWNNLPYIKDIIEKSVKITTGKQGYSDEDDLGMKALEDLLQTIPETVKFVQGESKSSGLGMFYKLSRATNIAGIPLHNMMMDIGSFVDTFLVGDDAEEIYNRDRVLYDIGAQKDEKYLNQKQFLADAMRAYAQGNKALGDQIIEEMKRNMDPEKVEEAVQKALAEEPEIEAAAEAAMRGDKKRKEELEKALKDKGYSEEMIQKKITSKLRSQRGSGEEIAKLLYEKDQNEKEVKEALEKWMQAYKAQGKTEQDAERDLKTAITRKYKEKYLEAKDSEERNEIVKRLQKILVNKKQIYSEEDFKRWNKEGKKKA